MKWRLIIPIWTLTCITFSSSFPLPVFVQDEMAVMYPMEFYPAYTHTDFINLDFAKWFRKATDSVKHFYNYVNSLIFGEIPREPIFGHYPTFNKHTNDAGDSPAANKISFEELKANVQGIQAFEIYKDADGNMFVKNLNDPNGGLQLLRQIKSGVELKKSENRLANQDPEVTTKIARNPFLWNDNLDKDKFFSGVFHNYAVNPQLLWHSGVFPFQPLKAFNIMGGIISDQNEPAQHESSEAPASTSNAPQTQNEEISSPKIDQTEQSSTSTTDQPELEITTLSEETKNEETSDGSNSSNDEKSSSQSSNESNPYEVIMEIERLKQNSSDSNSDESNNANQSELVSIQDSDIFDEPADEDDDDNDTDGNNDDDDEDDDDGNLTEFETEPISSDDESSQEPETTEKSTSEFTNDENTNANDGSDSTITETAAPSEGTEKTEIAEETTDAKIIENNLNKQNSDESDIMDRVLAIVHPSKN